MEYLKPLEVLPKIHTTPLAVVRIESPKVMVELDDLNEKRFRVTFEPYQSARMITADCYEPPSKRKIMANTIVLVENSLWILELKQNLKRSDKQANFMDKTQHFLIPLQDDFLEIVAWDFKWEYL